MSGGTSGNTQHGIEVCNNGTKQTIASAKGYIETGKWYDIRIEVRGVRVRCFIDGQLIHEATLPVSQAVYQSVQLNEDEDKLIIKIANPSAENRQVDVHLENMTTTGHATVNTLTATSGTTENTMVYPERVKPTGAQDVTLEGDETDFSLQVPPFSLNIYTIDVENVGSGSSADIRQPTTNTHHLSPITQPTYDLQGRRVNPRHSSSTILLSKGRKYIVR